MQLLNHRPSLAQSFDFSALGGRVLFRRVLLVEGTCMVGRSRHVSYQRTLLSYALLFGLTSLPAIRDYETSTSVEEYWGGVLLFLGWKGGGEWLSVREGSWKAEKCRMPLLEPLDKITILSGA